MLRIQSPAIQSREISEDLSGDHERVSPPKKSKSAKKFNDGIYRGLSRLRDGFCRPKNPAKFFADPEKSYDQV